LLPALDLGDLEGHAVDVPEHGRGRGLVLQTERLAVDLVELGLETLAGLLELGRDGPVLLGDEVPDLGFALGDEPERHGLDPAGAESAANGRPEDRADLVPDEAVEDAARLLRLDLAHVDGGRVLEGAPDGVPRDLVEEHATAAPAIPAGLVRVVAEGLRHVVRNGFALPVRVGGDDELVRGAGAPLQAPEHLS